MSRLVKCLQQQPDCIPPVRALQACVSLEGDSQAVLGRVRCMQALLRWPFASPWPRVELQRMLTLLPFYPQFLVAMPVPVNGQLVSARLLLLRPLIASLSPLMAWLLSRLGPPSSATPCLHPTLDLTKVLPDCLLGIMACLCDAFPDPAALLFLSRAFGTQQVPSETALRWHGSGTGSLGGPPRDIKRTWDLVSRQQPLVAAAAWALRRDILLHRAAAKLQS